MATGDAAAQRRIRFVRSPAPSPDATDDPRLLDLGALMAAAQLVGLAEAMLDQAVDYAKLREQFGQPIGAFQAVKHKLADVAVALEFGRPVVWRAAQALDDRLASAPVHVSHAKYAATDAAYLAAESAIQVHGAMGYTYEVDLHFWMKRSWALAGAWGDRSFHFNRVSSGRARRRAGRSARRTLSPEDPMPEAYIIDAVRTPMGRKKGSLAAVHPADLAAHPLRALIERTGIDAGAVDDCVWGCCDTIGPQAGDIGRTAWLVAGLPQHVPGTTVDRQCGSSQQALHFAAQGVMSGTQDLVVAGGSQAMNAIPIAAAMYAGQPYGFDNPFNTSPGWVARYGDGLLNQINSAEMIAEKWGIVARDDGGLRAGQPSARARRRKRPAGSIARSRRSADLEHGRDDPPGNDPRRPRRAEAGAGGRPHHRGRRQPELRRRGGAAGRQRTRGEGSRPDSPRPHPPPLGPRRRPGVDADSADPGDAPRARQGRDDGRRYRPVRMQRGVRLVCRWRGCRNSASRTRK